MSVDPRSETIEAAAAAKASANDLKECIARNRGEMRRLVSNLGAETGLGSLQQRALEKARAEKAHEIASLARRLNVPPPDVKATAPYTHAGSPMRQTRGGWTLDPVLAKAFDDAAQTARSSLNAPPKKGFTDRLFRDVEGQQRRTAQECLGTMTQVVACLSRAISNLEAEGRRVAARRADDARALRQRAEDDLTALLNRHADAQSRLPAPLLAWANEAWGDWVPRPAPLDVYAGQTRPRHDNALGVNGDFGRDIAIPYYVRPLANLHLVAVKTSRYSTHELVRALLIRSLAAQAPGTLHLTVFDPIGLGQSVSSLLELAEYDQNLLGGKIWSNTADFKSKLTELTAHVELVVQKYLRADYASLAEFNAAAGEIASPYRLLVVFDFPTQFDSDSFGELRRIIETGPRCGVGTILVTNGDEAPPHGVDIATLPKTMTRINMAAPFSFSAPNGYELISDFEPDSDRRLPNGVLERVIQVTGTNARDSGSRTVGFEKVFGLFNDEALRGVRPNLPKLASPLNLTDESTWWTQSTLEGISAPIGQRGARDVATLTFDSSNHSGALLLGRPGSGKSTLLHTYIAGLTTLYGPEELELHLIDFKEGVEFKVYAANGLPHARTVAIESDREFGVSVLQAIQAELTWRGSLLRGSSESHSSLETLRKATGERLPRIVLVFDEFQVLFARNDKLGGVAAEALETLIRQGRGFGVHVLLGSQSLAGLDALGSHVPQLLPVRILLPAAESDAFKVLGEANSEGSTLTAAGEGILNMAGGAVEANERFQGALIDEDARRTRVAAMRAKANGVGFTRRPVVFEGNAPIPAEDTPPEQFADEIRGADARTLRLRFGAPMALSGSADINLRREAGANMLLVARDAGVEGVVDSFSLPRSVAANVVISAAAQGAQVEVVDFLPPEEGLEASVRGLVDAELVTVTRRRQVPALLQRLRSEVSERVEADATSQDARLLVLYGMHRARDFDQESLDYDAEVDLPETVAAIMRDGPEVGVHTFLWFETVASISRRLPSAAVREVSWRLAGKMSADDSSSFVGVEGAASLREQQLLVVNEDRGQQQRCTTISAPGPEWTNALLLRLH